MRVILEADVFAQARYYSDLLAIFRLGEAGRHAVEIDADADKAYDAWRHARDPATQDMCDLAIALGLKADDQPPRWTIRVADLSAAIWDGREPNLPPRAAVRLLERPLKILVENRQSDAAFVRAIAKREYGKRLRRILEERWVEFDSVGGITASHALIEEECQDTESKMRLWVLFDSDAIAPNKPHRNAKQLRQLCARRRIACHQLRRRSIENYLPVPLLKESYVLEPPLRQNARKTRALALEKLRPEQRQHFNMKGGFAGDEARDDRHKVGNLYAGVPEHIRQDLHAGFGADIADLFREEKMVIKEEWLIEDGQQEEITEMLTELLSLV